MQYEDNKEVHLKDQLKIIFNLAIALIKKDLKQSEKKKKEKEEKEGLERHRLEEEKITEKEESVIKTPIFLPTKS